MSLSDLPGPVPDPAVVAAAAGGRPAAALAEPTRKVTARWVTGLVLVNVGINAAFFGPINVFIGQQAISIDAGNKEAILSLVTACGAAVSLVANPLFGALSDRTVSGFGRRAPGVLAGVINVANSLPQVIAPGLAFLSLQFFGGYVTLFTTAAVIGLLGAVFVVKIKGVD